MDIFNPHNNLHDHGKSNNQWRHKAGEELPQEGWLKLALMGINLMDVCMWDIMGWGEEAHMEQATGTNRGMAGRLS